MKKIIEDDFLLLPILTMEHNRKLVDAITIELVRLIMQKDNGMVRSKQQKMDNAYDLRNGEQEETRNGPISLVKNHP